MDALTNCLDRDDLDQEWLDQLIAGLGPHVGIVSFDCDSLSLLTGWMGFAASDQKLIDVSTSLRTQFPDREIVRSGGDEFFTIVEIQDLNQDFLETLVQSLVDVDIYDRVRKSSSYRDGTSGLIPPPYAFSVSCCFSRFDAPHELARMYKLDRANIDQIAIARYDGGLEITTEGDQRLTSVAVFAG